MLRTMSAKLNDMIVCPVCKGRLLQGDGERRELVCPRCRLAFEVRHDIPVMLRSAARNLDDNETRHYAERSAALDPK